MEIGDKEAGSEYHQKLAKRAENGEVGSDFQLFSYEGVKINCGTKKNPQWWVMVGPKAKLFTVDYAAAYPNDEIEAPVDAEGNVADDFTAPICDECKRIEGGHTRECSKSGALTFDDYLAYARAHYKTNHQSHARKMELTRLNDDEIRAWKLEQQQAGNGVEPETAKKSKKRGELSLVEQAIDR